jgi:hypothetical protein
MASETDVPGAGASHLGGSTPRKDEARRSVTRTTVTPGPGLENPETPATSEKPSKPPLVDRLRQTQHGELAAAREPLTGSHILRLSIAILMSVLWMLTIGGAILMLLLWQQDRASGVLSSQLDRTWDLFDLLREIERWVAFALLPIATAWIAMAAINVRRATGKRRNALAAAASLPIAVFGIWIVGSQIVADSDDWVSKAAGFVLQAIFAAIPLLALERVTDVAEARHRPLRVSYLISVVYLAHLQFLGGLSTIDQASEADEWGKLGAYLVIGGLIQVLAALSVNEAARSVEEGTENRYQLRQRFGESLLAQIDSP